MPDSLTVARTLAEKVRYTGDVSAMNIDRNASLPDSIKSFYSQSELGITKEVTPNLYGVLQKVCTRLHIPDSAVDAYVYADPIIQAQCYSGANAECVLRFSSGLIDILDDDEFCFVVGHELGHFLLGHGEVSDPIHRESVEHYMQLRAQELSADRLGLIAAESIDVGIRALMKTVSGLTSQHLRFDVGKYISQLQRPSVRFMENSRHSTHPSIVIRCRALLWFSINECIGEESDAYASSDMSKLDERIENDLAVYVDGPVRKQISDAKNDLAMWMAAYVIVQDDVFSKTEQSKFSDRFGNELLEKLMAFLSNTPVTDVQDAIYEKVKDARNGLEELIPSSFEDEVSAIAQWQGIG